MTKTKLNFFFPFLCLILCLIFPTACAAGVRKGLSLSLDAALPALFPALVLSGVLTRTLDAKSGKGSLLIPFFLGLVCGFPIGAKAVCDLVREEKITKRDGEKLLLFCNNAGPAFLISFCGETVLSDGKKGLFLFLFQGVISSLFLLFFFGKRLFQKEDGKDSTVKNSLSLGKILPAALQGATASFLYIMSCVIFFSFLSELILFLFPLAPIPSALLSLFLELTGGVGKLTSLPAAASFPLCALGCGWGGISVHLQTTGILSDAGLSAKTHLAGKAIFALLLFFLALFLQKLL